MYLKPLKAAACAALLSASFYCAPANAADVTLSWTFVNPMDSHFGAAATAFKEYVEAESDNHIKVEIFPAGALGGEREIMEGLQFGSIDIGHTSTTVAGNFVPELLVFDVPFLFRNATHARAVLDGPIGNKVLAVANGYGITGLGFGENGLRHLTNSKHPVRNPDDLSGLTIRTMENEIHIKAFATLGARPVPLAWPELYAALQQGVVDGQENPIANILTAKFYEVQPYMTLTGHVYAPSLVAMNTASWEQLADEDKAIVQGGVKKAIAVQRAAVEAYEAEGIDLLRERGVEIEEINRDEFVTKLAPAFEVYSERFGADVLNAIRDYK